MAKREFLQLAHDYAPRHTVAGYWWSEKIDGHRGFWDGGMTRGFLKSEVPWANTAKDARYVETQYATGLWSRYGNVVHAPSWWLDQLPKVLLDGEFWNGERRDGNRQIISSVVKKIHPIDTEWDRIKLMAFDMPSFDTVFADGLIDNIHYYKRFENIYGWYLNNAMRTHTYDLLLSKTARYRYAYDCLGRVLEDCQIADQLEQHQLSFNTPIADAEIKAAISEISRLKGEGLMIRNPDKYYECKRSYNILKVKKWKDSEAVVVGYTTGRVTDKGSKLLGLMGALIVEWKGRVFELSGFTESERILVNRQFTNEVHPEAYSSARIWAENNPEQECPEWINNILFPRGSEVTFKYQGLTKDGIPNPASYWRKGDRF